MSKIKLVKDKSFLNKIGHLKNQPHSKVLKISKILANKNNKGIEQIAV